MDLNHGPQWYMGQAWAFSRRRMVRNRSATHVLTTALRLIASSAASSSSSLTIHADIVSVIRFSSGG